MCRRRAPSHSGSSGELELILERWALSPGRSRPNSQSSTFDTAGFTLLELLVVMVIIALVAGLLLPALTRIKDKTRSVLCLSHVRQWGVALWMYADDAEEYFPYEGHFMTAVNIGLNLEAWYNSVAEYAGQPPLMRLYEQGLIPLPGHRSLFTCPSAVTVPAKKPTMTRPFFMYGFNNRMDPNGPRRFKRSQVLDPAQTVVFTENTESRFPSTAGRFTPARHNQHANLGFVDGHAEAVRSNDYYRTVQEDVSSRAEWTLPRVVYWYPYPGAPQ